MRLAISTIAWLAEEDARVAPLLASLGVEGVEFAPTRLWPDPAAASDTAIAAQRRYWADHGLAIPAMQALLYGRDDLQLFEGDAIRRAMLEHLGHVARIGGSLGAGVLVFGSPRNRRRGELADDQAAAIAVPFFRELGDLAAHHGTAFGLEANPPEYGCDFLRTHAEVRAFVRQVAHPAIVHHVDLGGATLAGEPASEVVAAAQPLGHVHASEPHLAPPVPGDPVLREAVDVLSQLRYDRWVSIEMRRQPDDPLGAIVAAVSTVQGAFRPS